MIKRYFKRLKTEFKGYNAGKFGKDVLAGITAVSYTHLTLPTNSLV